MESNTGSNGTMPPAVGGEQGSTTSAPALKVENGAAPVFLTRAAILSAQDITHEDVVVPEWGNGVVRVKALTAGQRDALEASCMVTEGRKQVFKSLDFRAKLVVRTACDERLKLIFSDADVAELTNKAAGPVNRLAEVAMRLSRITEEDVDEIVKNSERDRSVASGSESVSRSSAVSLER